jgi:hypothetical protein
MVERYTAAALREIAGLRAHVQVPAGGEIR